MNSDPDLEDHNPIKSEVKLDLSSGESDARRVKNAIVNRKASYNNWKRKFLQD